LSGSGSPSTISHQVGCGGGGRGVADDLGTLGAGEQGVRARHRARMAVVFQVEGVERWIEGWAFGETSSWPVADCGGTSLAATVKAAEHL
jgi:hypothetical protein